MPMAPNARLLWVHKTATSSSLSHSEDSERIQVFSQAQRTSRLSKLSLRRGRRLNTPEEKLELSQAHYQTKFVVAAYRDTQIQPALLLDPTCTPEERRAIDFYRSVTVTKVLTQHQDMQFWRDDVLCLTKLYPAFRHLIVAIGATHEVLAAEEDVANLNMFALQQCNKAVKLFRENSDTDRAVLVASCILITAYNLLRCDLVNADLSVEAGLRIASHAESSSPSPSASASSRWYHQDLTRLLTPLGFRSGYKLWDSEVSFRFEKVPLADNRLMIDVDCINGPFVDLEHVTRCFKALSTGVVAKVIRNMTVGAWVDPSSALSKEIERQLELFDFYWSVYYEAISSDDEIQELEMLSLRVAYYDLYLLFNTRVICPNELEADQNIDLYAIRLEILQLSEKVIEARRTGYTVTYLDRFVNKSVWASGLYTFDDGLRRRAAQLLRSQSCFQDGLLEWLRGTIIIMFADLDQEMRMGDQRLDTPVKRRPTPVGYHCREQSRELVLEYVQRNTDGQIERKEHCHDLDLGVDEMYSTEEINAGLKTIMASYKMYGKPMLVQDLTVRPMYFQGKLVPLHPESTTRCGIPR